MTDDMVTVPRKQLEDLSRRLADVEAKLADPAHEESGDPLRARFLLFVQRARQREEERRRP